MHVAEKRFVLKLVQNLELTRANGVLLPEPYMASSPLGPHSIQCLQILYLALNPGSNPVLLTKMYG